ncbi:MAG: STAS domain-containing protein [Bacilli bacterium]|jgi:anti-anti-sigma factor|nr:STAS domain-containing protein [Bacilli bacterium]
MLYMDLEYYQGVLFVRLDGHLTYKNAYKINNYLAPVILKHRIKYLVYNLFSVLDLDNAGVDAIIRTKYAIRSNQGSVYLCEVPHQFRKVMRRSHIKETLTEQSALELLKV